MTADRDHPAHVATVPVKRDPRPAQTRIAELDRVTLSRDVWGDGGARVSAGAIGTVVGIWAGGAAFEVEFTRPVPALVTVRAEAIAVHHPHRRS